MLGHPVAAALASIGVVWLGLVCQTSLPVSELPAVDLPTLVVTASLPGASPETMATSVAPPLEKHIGQIAGVTELTSINLLGTTRITVQFSAERDILGAFSDVQSAVNTAGSSLPKDMPAPPRIAKVNPALVPIIFMSATSSTMPLEQVFQFVDKVIAQPLAQIAGVSRVEIQGGQKPAVRIHVKPALLAASGIGLDDLNATIAAANANDPKGVVEDGNRSAFVTANDQLFTARAYGDVTVTERGGAITRLRDIAAVVDGQADDKLAAWYNGERALFLLVQREAGANTVATSERINAALPQLMKWLPPGIELKVAYDRTFKIKETLLESYKTMLIATLCVVVVILLALGDIRASIIPTLAIPVALLGTLIVMRLLGYSLNTLSLIALTVAIGFVVDDAIVMIENVSRYRDKGFSPFEATLLGAREITFTIISISVSLLAALLPLFIVPGVLGQFMREFSITLGAAVVLSCIVSLTLTPVMAANLYSGSAHTSRHVQTRGFLGYVGDRISEWSVATRDAYSGGLRLCLKWKFPTLAVLGFCCATTIYLFGVVPKGFLPPQDAGVIAGFTEAGQDVSFASMSRHQQEVARVIRQDPAVEGVLAYIGTSTGTSAGTGRLFVTLKPRLARPPIWEVINRLRPRLADIAGISTFLRSADDVNVGAREGWGKYQFTLLADDLSALEKGHRQVFDRLRHLPELTDVATDLRIGGLQAKLNIDRDKAALLQITALAIDDALYSAFGQRRITQVFDGFDSYEVVLDADAGALGDLDSLEQIHIRSAEGSMVPLSVVTTQSVSPTPTAIAHQGQFPSATISFNPAPGVALSNAIEAITSAVSALQLGETLHTSLEGNARAFASSSRSQPWIILVAILAIYIVLGILYESYLHPLTILSTLPPAGLGALLAAYISRSDFTLLSFIGLILLLGIVKKNAIMMIDFALKAERDDGLSAQDAIHRACLLRFRPIMMTTLTTLIGALPLAIDAGAGSEMRRSFGIVVIGGLLVSQALTLFTTPVVYVLLDQLSVWLQGLIRLASASIRPHRVGSP